MGETNYDRSKDLNEARKMADSLEPYVLGDQVYGSVGGGFFTGGNMPSLTIGALLMRVRRLREWRKPRHRPGRGPRSKA